MPKLRSRDTVAIGLATSVQALAGRPEAGSPFRVAVLGDFSGRSNRRRLDPGAALAARRPVAVDRDNFDEVLARHQVELRLRVEGTEVGEVVLRFACLDDFHPDRLYQGIEPFRSLRSTRSRLNDPTTFAAAAANVRSWAQDSPAPPVSPAQTAPEPGIELPSPSVEDLFDRILDEPQTQVPRSVADIDWTAIAREIGAPYSLSGTDPQLPELVGCVDSASAALMWRCSRSRDATACG